MMAKNHVASKEMRRKHKNILRKNFKSIYATINIIFYLLYVFVKNLYMKKIIALIVTIFCLVKAGETQIAKGAYLLGGQLGYSNSTYEYNNGLFSQKSNSGSFSLSIGKKFTENNVYGLRLFYNPSTTKYNNGNSYNQKSTNNGYGLGIYRRNFRKLSKDLYFFTDINARYNQTNTKDVDTASVVIKSNKNSSFSVGFTPGLSYRIYKKLNLELLIPDFASASYSISKSNLSNDMSKSTSFSINSSLTTYGILNSVGVGFFLIL